MRLGIKTRMLALWVTAGLALVGAWVSHRTRQYLSASPPRAAKGSVPPYLLVGTQLHLQPYLNEVRRTEQRQRPRRVLLLFSSDVCPVCQSNAEYWEQLVATVRPVNEGAVWFLTLNTDRVLSLPIQRAQDRGLSFRVFRVTDAAVLSLSTGLSGTPVTAILDERLVLRAISWGNTRDDLPQLRAVWESLGGE